jgi:hypothetical protein
MNQNDIKCWTFILYCPLFVEYFLIETKEVPKISLVNHSTNLIIKQNTLFYFREQDHHTKKSISIRGRRGRDRMVLI